jgi:peptidoglycan/xylan/chitin deacetylase (PgdA/CDA1 family)
VVLFYHGVEKNILDRTMQAQQLELQMFEKQMNFLRSNREVISMDDLEKSHAAGRPLDSRHVVLTFDDGYQNNFRIVAPMLNSWKLPFTIFVSTRHVSEARKFPNYFIRAGLLFTRESFVHLQSVNEGFELRNRSSRLAAMARLVAAAKKAPQVTVENIVAECKKLLSASKWQELDAIFASEKPMSWSEVQQAVNMGATIGSHCHDHCILHARQETHDVQTQLSKSKSTIEAHVGSCRYLAYPNGTARDVSNVARRAAQKAGFKIAFSTVPGEFTAGVDRYFAPRMFASPDYEEFCYLLNRTSMQNPVYASARSQSEGLANPAVASQN